MTTRNVHEFCVALWEAREEARLPRAAEISRGLALAVAADVTASADYEPHLDLRVAWAEAMVRGRRWQRPECRPEARDAVEATAAYLLGMPFAERPVTGKELAAGEGREKGEERLEMGNEGTHLYSIPNLESHIPQSLFTS